MKTIGLLGGMSWESTVEYYRLINQTVKENLGGLHSARCLLYSVDFEEIERYQHESNWHKAAEILINAARNLEKGSADFIVICTNTMHKLYDEIQANINVPILHIADATAEMILRQKINVVGLLGTRYTMEQDFYKSRLEAKGIKVLIPGEDARNTVHKVIYEELCLGEVNQTSRNQYKQIMNDLIQKGVNGIILGCTEIGLLVKQEDSPVPLFDTTLIHAKQAVEYALLL